jgi:hypothetical protein
LPALRDLYQAHVHNRDQFEILAFHEPTAENLADLDKNLQAIIRGPWAGQPWPFPVLLDSTGTTLQNFGITSFPTTLLIDPEGKLVGRVSAGELEKKLPRLSPAAWRARALDSQVPVRVNDTPLDKALNALAQFTRMEIRLDAGSLREAGLSPQTPVPLKLNGWISLRSALNLLLDPFDLTWVPASEGLLITRRQPGHDRPAVSAIQKHCVGRIEETLANKVQFDFKDKTLEEVVPLLERLSNFKYGYTENFILDPKQRRAGKLDPKMRVTGTARDVPYGQALQELLGPLGLTYVVRDELVVLTVAADGGRAK